MWLWHSSSRSTSASAGATPLCVGMTAACFFLSGIMAAAVAMQVWDKKKRSSLRRLGFDDDDAASASSNDCIYLDYNGTTPIDALVVEAMMPYFCTHYGNPGSAHVFGDLPKRAVQRTRRQILQHVLGCTVETSNDEDIDNPKTKGLVTDGSATAAGGGDSGGVVVPDSAIVFTACGTESNNLAIHWAIAHFHNQVKSKDAKAAASSTTTTLPHIVTCNIEHPAIDACLTQHEREGRCSVTRVPVQANGRVTADDMIAAIQSNTALVTLMLANNETGALQPVRPVAEYCRQHGILCLTDAAQAVGKISVRLADLGHPDMVTIVGHKFGAPKGIACLYVRPGCLDCAESGMMLPGLLVGGGQENGRRAGTENVPYIVGLGCAAELRCVPSTLTRNHLHLEALRTALLQTLHDELGASNVHVHGPTDPTERLPNTLSVALGGGGEDTQNDSSNDGTTSTRIPLVSSGQLLQAVRTTVAASAGAACHSTGSAVSSILQAMGMPDAVARATVRLSVGPDMTMDQVERAGRLLAAEVRRQSKN